MNTKGKMKRLLAIMVCLMMVFMSIPASAFATDEIAGSDPIVTEGGDSGDSGDTPPSDPGDTPPSDPGDTPPSDPGDAPDDEDPTLPDGGEVIDPVVLPQANPGGMGPMMTELVMESITTAVLLTDCDAHYGSKGNEKKCVICKDYTNDGFKIEKKPGNDQVFSGDEQGTANVGERVATFTFTSGLSGFNYVIVNVGNGNALGINHYIVNAPAGGFVEGTTYKIDLDELDPMTTTGISHLLFVNMPVELPPAPKTPVVEAEKAVEYVCDRSEVNAPRETFEFNLYDAKDEVNGTVMATASVSVKNWETGGSLSFVPVGDDELTAGTYWMKEVAGAADNGWAYDPNWYKVVIAGDATSGFTTTYSMADDSAIDGSVPVFENTYTYTAPPVEPGKAQIKVYKMTTKSAIDVAAPQGSYEFNFDLYNYDGVNDVRGTWVTDVKITIGHGEWNKADGKHFTGKVAPGTYLIVERADADMEKDWDFDKSEYKVVVTENTDKQNQCDVAYYQRNNAGEWVPLNGEKDAPVFLNILKGDNPLPPEEDKVELTINGSKTITYTNSKATGSQSFGFELYKYEDSIRVGNPLTQTATLSDWGKENAKNFAFTMSVEKRDYAFLLVENIKTVDGWAYDKHEFVVTATWNEEEEQFDVTYVRLAFGEEGEVGYDPEKEVDLAAFENHYTGGTTGGGNPDTVVVHYTPSTINDEPTPLAELPDPEVPLAVLPEPEVPLADIPQTGVDGNVAFNMLMLGLSLGAFLAAFAGRRRKADAEQE